MKKVIIASLVMLVIVSCKKKDTSAAEPEATTTTTTGSNPCPTCNFPDTVFTNSATGPKLVFKCKRNRLMAKNNYNT